MLELYPGLEKSGDFILSGKWQACVRAHCEIEKKTAYLAHSIPWHSVLLQKNSEMLIIIGYSD